MRDDELVAAALAGDAEAFAALFLRHEARVRAVLGRMIGEESEDLVQETALRAFLGLSQLRDRDRAGAWLCGIAVNLAKMRLRRRALERRVPGEAREEAGPEERAVLQLVRHTVELLPPAQREAVLLRYVDDLSCEEIAAILGTTPGAVRVRLHRARAQLRDELAVLAPERTTKEETEMIEMTLEDVLVRVAADDPATVVADQRIALLRERDGDRVLPIWIGAPEGDVLALGLHDETTPRPLTSDLLVRIVRVCGARVDRVAVTELRERTFHGVITLAVDGRVEEVDARPSDALNLAVRAGAPILAAEAVLAESGVSRSELELRLETESRAVGAELPEGRWHSLSAELVRDRYRPPR